MRVLIDARLLEAPVAPEVLHLCQLADHSMIELGSLETADDQIEAATATPYRLVVGQPDVENDHVPVIVEHPRHRDYLAIPLYQQWKRLANCDLSQFRRPPEKKLAEVLRARAALAWSADVFVTQWDLLLKSTARWIREANPMPPADALGLVGLFLRDRGEYAVTPVGELTTSFPRVLSYQFVARAVLPAGWRYYSAAHSTSGPTCPGGTIERLAETVFTRVARALAARDHVLARVQHRHEQTADFDVLYHLDAFLVQLVGALDALARVADLAAGLGTDPLRISWLAVEWRKALADKVKPFLAPLDGNAVQHNVVELICCLRNNIHGDALRAQPPTDKDGPQRFVLNLPEKDRRKISDAIARLGGPGGWGLAGLATGEITAHIVTFVERMTKEAIAVIDTFMALTPLEDLPGFNQANVITAPPPDDPVVGTAIAQALRMTFGLS